MSTCPGIIMTPLAMDETTLRHQLLLLVSNGEASTQDVREPYRQLDEAPTTM